MIRVIAYIDGFNLYHGVRSKGWRKYYWLDLRALAASLLKPGQTLAGVHYFTTRIKADGNNVQDMQRQTAYLEALGTLPGLQIQYGHFLEKPRRCRHCGAQWMDYEEKMTDVNIAIQLMTDAFDNTFDVALVISGDSDLTTPVRQVRTRFPAKRLIVVFPPQRKSKELRIAAHGHMHLGEDKLRQSQLPAQVQRPDGFTLQRPAHWR